MFHQIKRHPFAVHAFFDYSAVLTYSFPSEVLTPLLPPGLFLDEREGRGFVAVAMVKTKNLRPWFLPSFLGQNFFLIGYRIFARLKTREGRTLRGLRILRSETDKRFMAWSGNLLTHYNYHTVDIRETHQDGQIHVERAGGLDVTFHIGAEASLPAGSPFHDWREARMYAGPLPFTFDYEKESHSIVIIEGRRENWDPVPASVDVKRCDFVNDPMFQGAHPTLCAAFVVEKIPYQWAKGRLEKLDG